MVRKSRGPETVDRFCEMMLREHLRDVVNASCVSSSQTKDGIGNRGGVMQPFLVGTRERVLSKVNILNFTILFLTKHSNVVVNKIVLYNSASQLKRVTIV